MSRIFLFAFVLFIFGCNDANKKTENAKSPTTEEESVEIGAGTEISPQLEGVQDSAIRLGVDTVNSAQEEHAREGKDGQ